MRGNELNAAWTPTIYSDGGHLLYIGTSSTAMRNMIGTSSQRVVPDLDLIVRMEQVGGTGDNYEVTVRIGNGVSANSMPDQPVVDAGPDNGVDGVEYMFETATSDVDDDDLQYQWDWGDGSKVSEWYGPYTSGAPCTIGHTYAEGDYEVMVRAKDVFGAQTEWSAVHPVHIQCCVVRGNVDDDAGGNIDISDLVYLVDFMFTGGPPPPCPEAGNVDGSIDGTIDISDLVYLVDFMFTGGPPPPTCAP
ncbi:MAG: PKD domain-containing protein [candidate division Zixibacteria bacterium]|nr:PKD domain-containing protein [candidate division Zixibacteria bacterium]MDH3939030.1 PKD domain-containing protein [candidate division Zixibacteria bacterium]MDH4033270.1 PKD domain-containing protein [candidate division Zixibacteria bacterium]